MDTRVGKGKVMAEAAAQAEAPRPAVQLPLLGGPDAVDVAPRAERRGPGRRPGSENLVTRELRTFIGASFRHPLITLARIQAQDPVELARSLGCKPAEALDRIQRAAAELAPYLVGKMPVEDANGNAVLPVIQLVAPGAMEPVDIGGGVLDLVPMEMADFSHSGEGESGPVGQSESDASAETQASSGSAAAGHVIGDHADEAGR